MPAETAQRSVQCYHCRRRFEVGVRAVTVSCPGCHKRLVIEDLVIKNAQAYTKLQTCGRVVVQRRGHVMASLVEAHAGIEVLGVLEANAVTGGGRADRAEGNVEGGPGGTDAAGRGRGADHRGTFRGAGRSAGFGGGRTARGGAGALRVRSRSRTTVR